MSLTDLRIRKEQPRERSFRLTDEKGLYAEVAPNGSKYWRMKYRFAGKERLLALGVYGDVSLKEAREKRDRARRQLADGIDPGEHKRAIRAANLVAAENTFEAIARE